MEPDIENLERTNCSSSDSKTFLQPKLSLNPIVGAHLSPSFLSFYGSLKLWLRLFTNNKQQFPCVACKGIAHPHFQSCALQGAYW